MTTEERDNKLVRIIERLGQLTTEEYSTGAYRDKTVQELIDSANAIIGLHMELVASRREAAELLRLTKLERDLIKEKGKPH